jgi:hypothetical protein
MALGQRRKPLYVLYQLALVITFFGWLDIGMGIVRAGGLTGFARFGSRYLLWIGCNTVFLYLYLRKKLAAWYVAFCSVLGITLLAILQDWDTSGEEVTKLVGGVFLFMGVGAYLLVRYNAYAEYVRDLTTEQGLD